MALPGIYSAMCVSKHLSTAPTPKFAAIHLEFRAFRDRFASCRGTVWCGFCTYIIIASHAHRLRNFGHVFDDGALLQSLYVIQTGKTIVFNIYILFQNLKKPMVSASILMSFLGRHLFLV
jgi:hypothetical protein